jgi:hypothetical protein
MAVQILIEPKSSVLVRGKVQQVPITLVVDEPLKVRGLHALFHGAQETKATYTTYNAATKSTQTHTAVQHVDVVRRAWVLSGNERMGCFANLADGLATLFGGGEHREMLPGKYPFDVEVEVPGDAPGTFQAKKCRIFYELSVRLDVPLAGDPQATCAFTLPDDQPAPGSTGLVRTRWPEDEGRGLWDSWFGPDVRVEAALTENVYRPGETIDGVFRVDTPAPLACRKITAMLVGYERTQAQGHKDTVSHQGPPTVVATPGGIDRAHKQDFQLPAVAAGPATNKGQLFTIDWYVQLQLDVPWAKDPKVRIPITLVAG